MLRIVPHTVTRVGRSYEHFFGRIRTIPPGSLEHVEGVGEALEDVWRADVVLLPPRRERQREREKERERERGRERESETVAGGCESRV